MSWRASASTRPTYGVGDEPDSGSANWYVDLLAEDAELLADMTVRAFRRAYGITHPAFLTADGLLPDAPHEHAAPAVPAATTSRWSSRSSTRPTPCAR